MIAYVDASVLLRVALGQPDVLVEWPQIQQGVASALVMTESLRALDRLRLRASLADKEVAKRRATIFALIASLELVDIDAVVLDRAAQPMPTELGTLDAIHLVSARLLGPALGVVIAYDTRLIGGARAAKLPTIVPR